MFAHPVLRVWEDAENNVWVQSVSTSPATRQDAVALQESLAEALTSNKAREVGHCPIREKIYVSCFEEIIRQVAVDCIERGQLLHLVKTDIQERVKSLEKLYISGLAFGMRKALLTEDRKQFSILTVEQLEKDISEKKNELELVSQKFADLERQLDEEAQLAKNQHNENACALEEENTQLKTRLESILAVPKT